MRMPPGKKTLVGVLSLATSIIATDGLVAGAAHAHSVRATAENLAALRRWESGGNYRANTGNGYYGAYQFSRRTWRSLGYGGLPHQARPAVQDEAARRLVARAGWRPWPGCSRRLGLH